MIRSDEIETKYMRLSDRVLFALELSLKQEDIQISEMLAKALELSMTRNTGGGEFIERRDYSPAVEAALDALDKMKNARKAG